MDSNSSCRPWSGLRSDLLLKIAKCIDSRVDALRFRAVCYSWRSAFPLPPLIPSPCPSLKLPFPIAPNPSLNPRRRGYFMLVESTIYALQPLDEISKSSNSMETWIIRIRESKPGKVTLLEPLFPLTCEDQHGKLLKVLNLLEYRVSVISKSYTLEFLELGESPPLDFNELKSTTKIKKVVTSSSLDKIGDGFALMALHRGVDLAIWRMGDKNWNSIKENRKRLVYNDIAYHNGRFYAIDINGIVVSVNPATLELTQLPSIVWPGYGHGGQNKHLIKSSGILFAMDVYESRGPIVVHQLDEEKGEWVYIDWVDAKLDGLDELALFIGHGVSFSVSGKQFLGCKRNCVYYWDISLAGDDAYPGYDTRIYDLKFDKARALAKLPAPYSKLFWPPPAWLKSGP